MGEKFHLSLFNFISIHFQVVYTNLNPGSNKCFQVCFLYINYFKVLLIKTSLINLIKFLMAS